MPATANASTRSLLPGGYGRSGYYVGPNPPQLLTGHGPLVTDREGRELIDANGNFTTLVLGHAHPSVLDAIVNAARSGTCFGLGYDGEEGLAAMIAERMADVEQVKFANSGTEAVMTALRLARGMTGRNKVVAVRGAYHGSSDTALIVRSGGRAPGVSPRVAEDIELVGLNSVDELDAAFERSGDETAAMLVDLLPNYTGLIQATPEFVRRARQLCTKHGAYLIYDETVSFRLRVGGLQTEYDDQPDLTTLGKVIGGGLPIGAVVGTAAAMDALSPSSDRPVDSSGTFTGNPVSIAAGQACLSVLQSAVIDRINERGERLKQALKTGAPEGWVVRGRGSLVRVMPEHPSSAVDATRRLWWAAYERGLLMMPTGKLAINAAMDDNAVGEIAARTLDALDEIGPLVESSSNVG